MTSRRRNLAAEMELFAVCLFLLAAATVGRISTLEQLSRADEGKISDPEVHQSDDVFPDEAGTTSWTHAASTNAEAGIASPTTVKDLSAAVLSTDSRSVWTATSTASTPSRTCSAVVTESSHLTAALGTALLIPCPLLNRTSNFASIAWTHMPTGSTISRRVNERIVSSLTRRLIFAKDGTSLVVVAVRETDAFQCTLFASDNECRSATVSIDVQHCQSPEMNPCANGGNCSILLPSTPAAAVDCLCVFGYRGWRCQDEISRGVWLIILFWVAIVLEVMLIFAGAYRFLQLRRVTTALPDDQDIPVYKLLSMASVVRTAAQ